MPKRKRSLALVCQFHWHVHANILFYRQFLNHILVEPDALACSICNFTSLHLQGRKVLITLNTKPGKEIIASLVKAVNGQVCNPSRLFITAKSTCFLNHPYPLLFSPCSSNTGEDDENPSLWHEHQENFHLKQLHKPTPSESGSSHIHDLLTTQPRHRTPRSGAQFTDCTLMI